jgi:hypothetical protein
MGLRLELMSFMGFSMVHRNNAYSKSVNDHIQGKVYLIDALQYFLCRYITLVSFRGAVGATPIITTPLEPA